MNISVTEKLKAACRFAGIRVVRIRTPGRNKGKWGWTAVVDGVLERSCGSFNSEDWAYAAAYAHYTKR